MARFAGYVSLSGKIVSSLTFLSLIKCSPKSESKAKRRKMAPRLFAVVSARFAVGVLCTITLISFTRARSWAQGIALSTPIPGAGHAYIGLLNETVDPASLHYA